jgi:hypothetical protein
MARVDVKGLHKRIEALKEAAIGYSDAAIRVNGRMSESTRSLRAADANDAYRLLESAAIELVKVLATGDDGKRVGFASSIVLGWLNELQAQIDGNPSVLALRIEALKKAPYAAVFERAEKEASK